MKEEITQVKFIKEFDGFEFWVVCSQSTTCSSWWDCQFSRISLLNLSHFVVELFNCPTLNGADKLFLGFGNHCISVDKSTENNTFTHYLEQIASKLAF